MDKLKHQSRRTFKRSNWGWGKYALRDTILKKACHNDTLTAEVTIQILMGVDDYKTWFPTSSFSPSKLSAFRKNKHANIIFRVSDHNDGEMQIMHANTTILFMEAPAMETIIMDGGNGGDNGGEIEHRTASTTVTIPNTNPTHFRSMLEFIYSEFTSFLDGTRSLEYLQELLDVTNKFGCWRLKLTIEAKIINDHLMNDTALPMLFYAQANNCDMLFEACLRAIGINSALAFRGENAAQLWACPELMKQIQGYVSGEYWDDGVDDKYSTMLISELYEELEKQDKLDLESDLNRAELLKLVREQVNE
mmetsp:Transcript_10368/g.29565  ORF Transcript_10368/g.29565 Transcript_10368/m.29565 type:complete len:306 (+) Transcript_10368:526-1443(+)